MNYSLNVKSSSIVHTLLSNCVKLLGKVQKLLIKCISYSVISKRIRVVSPKFYTARKNFTGPPVPTVPTNFKSGWCLSTFSLWTPMSMDGMEERLVLIDFPIYPTPFSCDTFSPVLTTIMKYEAELGGSFLKRIKVVPYLIFVTGATGIPV